MVDHNETHTDTSQGRSAYGIPQGVASRNPGGVKTTGANGEVTHAEVDALKADAAPVLTALENSMVAEAFGETLPLVGDRFTATWEANVAGFRFIGRIKTAATEGLNALTGPGPFTPAQVESAINGRLTANGFNSGSRVLVTTAGDHVQLAFETVDTFSSIAVPIAVDFGLPNLDLSLENPANASSSGSLVCNFTMGLDATGFYLDSSSPHTITFNTTTTVSTGLNAAVQFAKLPYRLNDDTSPRSSHSANFALTLKDPDGNGRIRPAETMGNPDLIDGTVSGSAALSFAITSDLPANVAMPKVRTDLGITWAYPGAVLDVGDDNSSFGSVPSVTLGSASLNVHSLLKAFANDLLYQISYYTNPLDDLINVLTAEIPLLSDLGSEAVTILDVAGVEPEAVAAIGGLDAISDLRSWIFASNTADTVWVNMSSFALGGADLRTDPLIAMDRNLTAAPTARPADVLTFLSQVDGVEGLEFPLLTDPLLIGDLLLGRPADLFVWRSPEISFQEDFQAFYPVLGPIGVTLGGLAGVRTQFGFGYDMQGIFDYVAGGGTSTDLLANGFYGLALDEEGDPYTGITLFAGITAGVEANVIIASVGVEGDITAEIGMYLNDQIGDEFGRVRGNTLSALPLDDLFYAAGSLSAGLRAYVEFGISPFSVGYDWDSPRVILINFDSRDTDTPVLAEVTANDTLVLNVGDRSGRRIHGNLDDRAEEFTITGGAGVEVSFMGESNSFSTPAKILAEPNLRGDVIEIAADLTVPAEMHGGDGRDELIGGAGPDLIHGDDGPDYLRGRGNSNQLFGGADNDELVGGPGSDTLNGGPGDDTASWADDIAPVILDLRIGSVGGAAALDTLVSIERYRGTPFNDVMDGSESNDSLLSGEGGDDLIRGHDGQDLLEGDSGADTIEGGDGNDMVIGGPGADSLDGGQGIDTLSYLSPAIPNLPPGVRMEPVTVNLATGTGSRGDALGDILTGFEILFGSGVPAGYDTPTGTGDDLTGSDNADTIHGMGGTDRIRGGGGNDVLWGDSELADSPLMAGFDADEMYGDAGDDQLFGQWDNDRMEGGEGNDLLEGGPGNDTLDGGAGMDSLNGGEDDDWITTNDTTSIDTLEGGTGYNRLSADYSDKTTPLEFIVGDNNSHTFPDGDSFADMQTLGVLTSGSGNDVIQLSDGLEPAKWSKTINAGPGDDLVIADSRLPYPGNPGSSTADQVHGDAGVDTLSFEQSYGGVAANLSSGGLGGAASGMTMSGFENLIGSEHVDDLTGDAGDNILTPLQGGQSRPQGSDRVTGGAGSDTLRLDFSDDPAANVNGIYMTPNYTTGYESINRGPVGGIAESTHTYWQIERFEIIGTSKRDVIYSEGLGGDGTNFNDIFHGLGGNDTIGSAMGDDLIDGGDGDDAINIGTGNDKAFGGPGNDTITFVKSDNYTTLYGQDEADGGPGDDSIYNISNNNLLTTSAAAAGTSFRCDGGTGYDILYGDYGNQSMPIIWDENQPSIQIEFPDGTYIRNIERLVHFYAGSGNDVFLLKDRENTLLNTGAGNDIINPGLGADTVRGSAGNDLVIMDYSVGDDADIGGVTYYSAFSPARHERRRISDGTLLDYLVLIDCERFHVTGSSKDDQLYGLNGNDIMFGGAGDDVLSNDNNQGNDYMDGGPGADSMLGGSGSDTYIVDNPGDTVRETNSSNFDQGGSEVVISSVSFSLPTGFETLTLVDGALNGTGNSQANAITGNAMNNYLRGEGSLDTLNGGGGAAELDRLNGGAAADTFVLGDGSRRFYDDGNPATPGLDGYAVIEDFTPAHSDRLRLTGNTTEYFLAESPVAETPGTALYHDSNGSGVLEPENDELIAILISPVTLTVANTLDNAVTPAPVTLATIGLDESPQLSISNEGGGPMPGITFTINDPFPANARIDVEVSTDLGQSDPWMSIASKSGTGAWTGIGEIVIGTPANGSVTVSVTDLRQISGISRRFLRVKASSL